MAQNSQRRHDLRVKLCVFSVCHSMAKSTSVAGDKFASSNTGSQCNTNQLPQPLPIRPGSISSYSFPYLEPCRSLHRVNNGSLWQVPISFISLETALRPFAICRVRRSSKSKRVHIRFGLIWNSKRRFLSSYSKSQKPGRSTPSLSWCMPQTRSFYRQWRSGGDVFTKGERIYLTIPDSESPCE
jgi:hypothetical protein